MTRAGGDTLTRFLLTLSLAPSLALALAGCGGPGADAHKKEAAPTSPFLAALGESADSVEPKSELFFLEGPEDFRVLVGQPAGGWTEARANTVLLGASSTG